jgi:hypothetical protein
VEKLFQKAAMTVVKKKKILHAALTINLPHPKHQ